MIYFSLLAVQVRANLPCFNYLGKLPTKKIVVLAPTGVAALKVKGQTIHSFFGFPPRLIDPRRDIKKRRYRQLYQKLDTIVIDEISMVRADMLDNIDYFLRLHREDPRPFGGVQMVFFGDLFQLPPVVATEIEKQIFRTTYKSPYFFSAKVIQPPVSMEMIELNTVYRQENRHFLRLLEGIRLNRLDYDDLEDLNARHLPEEPNPEFAITLSARNARVDAINKQGLEAIPFPAKTYLAKGEWKFPRASFSYRRLVAPKTECTGHVLTQ